MKRFVRSYKTRFIKNAAEFTKYYKKKLQCSCCEFSLEPAALHFHHINPKDKKYELAKLFDTGDVELLLQELSICTVLCANCHAIYHYSDDTELSSSVALSFKPIDLDLFLSCVEEFGLHEETIQFEFTNDTELQFEKVTPVIEDNDNAVTADAQESPQQVEMKSTESFILFCKSNNAVGVKTVMKAYKTYFGKSCGVAKAQKYRDILLEDDNDTEVEPFEITPKITKRFYEDLTVEDKELICSMYHNNYSLKRITMTIFGDNVWGGFYNAILRRVIEDSGTEFIVKYNKI